MNSKVLKAFPTPTRRFGVGQTVAASDIDGPLKLEDWQRLGYVESEKPKKRTDPEVKEPLQ